MCTISAKDMQSIPEKDPGKLDMIVKRVSVPVGLEELMEGLTKEVLLKKPKDLYLFASEYFSRLIILRNRSSNHKAYPIRTVQSVTQVKTKETTPTSLPRPSTHLSRQLSVRGQPAPNQQKTPNQKSRERRTTAEQSKNTSTTQLVNRGSNQSTPRESKRTTPRKADQTKSPTKSFTKKDIKNGMEGSNRKVNIHQKKKDSKKAHGSIETNQSINVKPVPVNKISNEINSNQIKHTLAQINAKKKQDAELTIEEKPENSEKEIVTSIASTEENEEKHEMELNESVNGGGIEPQSDQKSTKDTETNKISTSMEDNQEKEVNNKAANTAIVHNQKETNNALSMTLINAEKLATTEDNKIIQETDQKLAELQDGGITKLEETAGITKNKESESSKSHEAEKLLDEKSSDQTGNVHNEIKELSNGKLTSSSTLINAEKNVTTENNKIIQHTDQMHIPVLEDGSFSDKSVDITNEEKSGSSKSHKAEKLLDEKIIHNTEHTPNEINEPSNSKLGILKPEETIAPQKSENNLVANKSSEPKVLSIEMKQMEDSDDLLIVNLSDQPSVSQLEPSDPETSTSDQKNQFLRKIKDVAVPQDLLGHLQQAVGLQPDQSKGRVDSPVKDFLHTFIKNEQNHVFAPITQVPMKSKFSSVKDLLELDVTIPKDDSSETSTSDTKSLQLIIVDENSSESNVPKSNAEIDDLGSYAEDSIVMENRGLIGQETLRGLSLEFNDSKTDSSSGSGDITYNISPKEDSDAKKEEAKVKPVDQQSEQNPMDSNKDKVEDSEDTIVIERVEPEVIKENKVLGSISHEEVAILTDETSEMKGKDIMPDKAKKIPKIGEIEQIASVIEVVKDVSSLEKPSTSIPSTVKEYLTNFLQNEQHSVFKPEISSQIPQPIKRSSKLTSKTKPERSLSHSNLHGSDKDNARMKRARSVGVMKAKEGSLVSSIPTSARKSAGRRPLVRQPEASSKELAEKLNFKRSKSSDGESSQSEKDNSVKRDKHSKAGIAKKVAKSVEKLAGQVLNIPQNKGKDQGHASEKDESSKEDQLNAAVKIQSTWKGFTTRKNLKEFQTKKLRSIVKIQALTRGFLERMRYRKLNVRLNAENDTTKSVINADTTNNEEAGKDTINKEEGTDINKVQKEETVSLVSLTSHEILSVKEVDKDMLPLHAAEGVAMDSSGNELREIYISPENNNDYPSEEVGDVLKKEDDNIKIVKNNNSASTTTEDEKMTTNFDLKTKIEHTATENDAKSEKINQEDTTKDIESNIATEDKMKDIIPKKDREDENRVVTNETNVDYKNEVLQNTLNIAKSGQVDSTFMKIEPVIKNFSDLTTNENSLAKQENTNNTTTFAKEEETNKVGTTEENLEKTNITSTDQDSNADGTIQRRKRQVQQDLANETVTVDGADSISNILKDFDNKSTIGILKEDKKTINDSLEKPEIKEKTNQQDGPLNSAEEQSDQLDQKAVELKEGVNSEFNEDVKKEIIVKPIPEDEDDNNKSRFNKEDTIYSTSSESELKEMRTETERKVKVEEKKTDEGNTNSDKPKVYSGDTIEKNEGTRNTEDVVKKTVIPFLEEAILSKNQSTEDKFEISNGNKTKSNVNQETLDVNVKTDILSDQDVERKNRVNDEIIFGEAGSKNNDLESKIKKEEEEVQKDKLEIKSSVGQLSSEDSSGTPVNKNENSVNISNLSKITGNIKENKLSSQSINQLQDEKDITKILENNVEVPAEAERKEMQRIKNEVLPKIEDNNTKQVKENPTDINHINEAEDSSDTTISNNQSSVNASFLSKDTITTRQNELNSELKNKIEDEQVITKTLENNLAVSSGAGEKQTEETKIDVSTVPLHKTEDTNNKQLEENPTVSSTDQIEDTSINKNLNAESTSNLSQDTIPTSDNELNSELKNKIKNQQAVTKNVENNVGLSLETEQKENREIPTVNTEDQATVNKSQGAVNINNLSIPSEAELRNPEGVKSGISTVLLPKIEDITNREEENPAVITEDQATINETQEAVNTNNSSISSETEQETTDEMKNDVSTVLLHKVEDINNKPPKEHPAVINADLATINRSQDAVNVNNSSISFEAELQKPEENKSDVTTNNADAPKIEDITNKQLEENQTVINEDQATIMNTQEAVNTNNSSISSEAEREKTDEMRNDVSIVPLRKIEDINNKQLEEQPTVINEDPATIIKTQEVVNTNNSLIAFEVEQDKTDEKKIGVSTVLLRKIEDINNKPLEEIPTVNNENLATNNKSQDAVHINSSTSSSEAEKKNTEKIKSGVSTKAVSEIDEERVTQKNLEDDAVVSSKLEQKETEEIMKDNTFVSEYNIKDTSNKQLEEIPTNINEQATINKSQDVENINTSSISSEVEQKETEEIKSDASTVSLPKIEDINNKQLEELRTVNNEDQATINNSQDAVNINNLSISSEAEEKKIGETKSSLSIDSLSKIEEERTTKKILEDNAVVFAKTEQQGVRNINNSSISSEAEQKDAEESESDASTVSPPKIEDINSKQLEEISTDINEDQATINKSQDAENINTSSISSEAEQTETEEIKSDASTAFLPKIEDNINKQLEDIPTVIKEDQAIINKGQDAVNINNSSISSVAEKEGIGETKCSVSTDPLSKIEDEQVISKFLEGNAVVFSKIKQKETEEIKKDDSVSEHKIKDTSNKQLEENPTVIDEDQATINKIQHVENINNPSNDSVTTSTELNKEFKNKIDKEQLITEDVENNAMVSFGTEDGFEDVKSDVSNALLSNITDVNEKQVEENLMVINADQAQDFCATSINKNENTVNNSTTNDQNIESKDKIQHEPVTTKILDVNEEVSSEVNQNKTEEVTSDISTSSLNKIEDTNNEQLEKNQTVINADNLTQDTLATKNNEFKLEFKNEIEDEQVGAKILEDHVVVSSQAEQKETEEKDSCDTSIIRNQNAVNIGLSKDSLTTSDNEVKIESENEKILEENVVVCPEADQINSNVSTVPLSKNEDINTNQLQDISDIVNDKVKDSMKNAVTTNKDHDEVDNHTSSGIENTIEKEVDENVEDTSETKYEKTVNITQETLEKDKPNIAVGMNQDNTNRKKIPLTDTEEENDKKDEKVLEHEQLLVTELENECHITSEDNLDSSKDKPSIGTELDATNIKSEDTNDVHTTDKQDNNNKEESERVTSQISKNMSESNIVNEVGNKNEDSKNVTTNGKVEQIEESINVPNESAKTELEDKYGILPQADKIESLSETKGISSELSDRPNLLIHLQNSSEEHVLSNKTSLNDSLSQTGDDDEGDKKLSELVNSDEKPPHNSKTDTETSEATKQKNKPDFYRTDTVVEPVLVKKSIQQLGGDSQEDQTDNNNNSNKDESSLEKEVREAVDDVMKETRKMDAETIDAMLKNLPSVPTGKAESTESEPMADDLSSVDSADSVVTVIMKPKQEQEPTRNLPGRAFSTSALEDHVELLDQVQNSLLDELSGKNSKSKFDIEQLRKELHDAANLYKDDEETPIPTVCHQPEMLEYLYDFEPEDPACFDRVLKTPLRELPDILEEEDSLEVSPKLTNEIIINDDSIEIGKEHHRLMHTGEMHDSVLVNNGLGGLVVGGEEHQSQLKHSSEFHDTVLVPLPSGADVKITNASGETSPQSQQGPDLANRMDSGNQTNQQPPAGVTAVTSRRHKDATQAQPSLKDTAPAGLSSAGPAQSPMRIANEAMESESNNNNKKNNAIVTNVPEKNMEVEAATKIQAGFRGYQVRKQLKAKTAAIDQKRQLRKRSSKENIKSPELEEKSAVKIQAGVRGFLVRRRQKKQSNNSSASA